MNCRKVTHLLSAYMDGELPGIESLQIRDHLSLCSECGSEYDELLRMKRLLGRLKIKEPASNMVADVLQTIRIEADLRVERSPASRLHNLADSVRAALAAPRVIGLGFGVVAIAALLYSQTVSGNQVQVVGEWDRSVPPASAFTSGVRYPSSSRFISPALRGSASGNSFETVSFGSGYQGFHEAPSQFGSSSGYFVHSP